MNGSSFEDRVCNRLGNTWRYFRWITAEETERFECERSDILQTFPPGITYSFDDMKPHYGPLSPGCLHCGNGDWSCLFINQVCNADCFYCPMEPARREAPPPTAHGIDFPDPNVYIEFIRKAGFHGIGLSGGEPLLNMDRTVAYAEKIRSELSDSVYLWLYTNGILATEGRLQRLYEAGIDEIRFDISAINYSLKPLRRARELPWTCTVEIPAIPEDEERLAKLLPALDDTGVDHLHLHQLTMNPWNEQRFRGRPYTMLFHPSMAVAESELSALRLLTQAADNDLRMAVQYCGRGYKQVFQGRGRRLRLLQLGWGDTPPGTVTQNGYISRDSVTETPLYVFPSEQESQVIPETIPARAAGCTIPTPCHTVSLHEELLEPVLVQKSGKLDEVPVPVPELNYIAIRLLPVSHHDIDDLDITD